MKLFDYIKLGIGFYIGYKLAENIDDSLGKICIDFKQRIEKGY